MPDSIFFNPYLEERNNMLSKRYSIKKESMAGMNDAKQK